MGWEFVKKQNVEEENNRWENNFFFTLINWWLVFEWENFKRGVLSNVVYHVYVISRFIVFH